MSGLKLLLHKNPSLRQGADLVFVPYAASLWREGRLILVVALEQEDYRSLAQSFGCSVREIQEERKTRSLFGPPKIIAYAADEREELEAFEGALDFPEVKKTLFEWVADIIDTMVATVVQRHV